MRKAVWVMTSFQVFPLFALRVYYSTTVQFSHGATISTFMGLVGTMLTTFCYSLDDLLF